MDFRGPADAPGSKGEYARVELHDGLVCLVAPTLDLDLQLDLFAHALDVVRDLGDDMVNRVLDVSHDPETDLVSHTLYELPPRPR